MPRLIVGTAGHIDHGKSSLVRALTGTDPDRLPEEKRRGITIDLGFAFLAEIAAIIDVPGHERFIRNMVAGAATIDFALLVVAADDGVMPQTTEHLHILRLLGVSRGCIVLTKIDVPEPEWIELVEDQIRNATRRTFLENAPLFRVDSVHGAGIPEFRAQLISLLSALTPRAGRGVFRLPIDRVFSIKGRGTVVTGTVLSGDLIAEHEVRLYPAGDKLRVKHLESHGAAQSEVHPGMRAALNLQGDTTHVERGQTVGPARGLHSTTRVAVKIELLPGTESLKERQRIRFLIGTTEALGRVQLLQQSPQEVWANILLEEPIVAAWSDRFILRRYSPLETLGGGIILDPAPPPLRARDLPRELAALQRLADPDFEHAVLSYISVRGATALSTAEIAERFAAEEARVHEILSASSDVLCVANAWLPRPLAAAAEQAILAELKSAFSAKSGQIGFSPSSLRDKTLAHLPTPIFEVLVQRLVDDGKIVREAGLLRFPERTVVVTAEQQRAITHLTALLTAAAFTPPAADALAEALSKSKPEIAKLLVIMERQGVCKRLGLDLFFDSASFEQATSTVLAALKQNGQLSVSEVSTLLNSSRKYVVPLLEYLDERGLTRREGNVRVPGRALSAPEAGAA